MAAVFVVLGGAPASAESFKDLLSDSLQNHKRIKAAEADLAAAREQIRVALGSWFPTLDVTANYGAEYQDKPTGTANTHLSPREVDLSLTQLLWDFDATDAAIQTAKLTYENSLMVLSATRQGLILESIAAYLTLFSSSQILDFARQSEANISRQTELEDARVKRGSGFSTDVLQAKTQLAGAQARRVQAEGAMMTARNRFRAIFGDDVGDLDALVKPKTPVELLPPTLEEAIATTFEGNLNLKLSKIAAQIARESVRSTKAGQFFPTLNAIAESKYKNDVGGTIGTKREDLIKVELSYSLNLGLTAINTLRAAEGTLAASENRYQDARDLIEEQIRNAWQVLLTQKETAEFLGNQANIAGEFLELARKERKLGQRSLIDVLAGETALINASSDAAAAENQVDLAVYNVLAAMGQLEMDVIQ